MANSADTLRRWFGLFFLAVAFGLLVWGRIVLWDRLSPIAFVIYWFLCFVFTIAAIVTALIDVRVTRKRARQEHEDLIQRTLDEIDHEPRDKKKE